MRRRFFQTDAERQAARTKLAALSQTILRDVPGCALASDQQYRECDLAEANRLLARPWEIIGTVEHGDKRGRELGYPTANVALTDFQVPKFGIYAVRCEVDGRRHDGVASLGIRPTFDQTDVKLEVYLFDFSGDLYGRSMRVEFHAFLRPELKYEGPEALKRQIALDVTEAKRVLAQA